MPKPASVLREEVHLRSPVTFCEMMRGGRVEVLGVQVLEVEVLGAEVQPLHLGLGRFGGQALRAWTRQKVAGLCLTNGRLGRQCFPVGREPHASWEPVAAGLRWRTRRRREDRANRGGCVPGL